MERSRDAVSVRGVCACVAGAALYWLSRVIGRDAANLKNLPRIQQLAELATLLDKERKSRPLIVAATGRVGSDQPMDCQQSSMRAVILEDVEVVLALRQSDSGSWIQDAPKITELRREVPWYLEDGTTKVMVVGAQGASGLELTVSSVLFEDKPSSKTTLETLEQWLRVRKVLGAKRVQKVLPVGQSLTVVGEALMDDGGSLRLRHPRKHPFYITPNGLDNLASGLVQQSRVLKATALLCVGAGLWLLNTHAYEFIHRRWRRRMFQRFMEVTAVEIARVREEREQQAGSATADGQAAVERAEGREEGGANGLLYGDMADGSMPDICIICLDQKYNSVFLPCAHLCVCQSCSANLATCPLCRRNIDRVIRVYRH